MTFLRGPDKPGGGAFPRRDSARSERLELPHRAQPVASALRSAIPETYTVTFPHRDQVYSVLALSRRTGR